MPILEISSLELMEWYMIDLNRLRKDREDILSVKEQIDWIVSFPKEEFIAERRNPLSLKYLLIEAVEAISDICQHVLAKTRGIACSGYVDCIIKAGSYGLISPGLSNKLKRLADLRNSLIHRYWIIRDEELYDITKENKEDLVDFVKEIENWIKKNFQEA